MTTKRFMVDDAGTLIDMTNGNNYDYVSDVCGLLNELHEENEQLRHDATILIQSNQDYRKENEQLKQAIAETEKMVQSTYDELTKLRCIKKNLGRIKSQWDWIMEAVQYD